MKTLGGDRAGQETPFQATKTNGATQTRETTRLKYTEEQTRGRCGESGKRDGGSKTENNGDKTDLQSKTGNRQCCHSYF